MARAITIKEYNQLIGRLAKCVVSKKNQYEVPALKSIEGLVKARVFNKRESITGARRKYKSAYYAKKYKKDGDVDMSKSGDLLRDFTVYRYNGNNVMGFKQDLSRIKAAAEEKRRGSAMFKPNDKELKKLKDVATKRIAKVMNECI